MNARYIAQGPLGRWAIFLWVFFLLPGNLFSSDKKDFRDRSQEVYVEELIVQARARQLWKERQWLNLVHYRKKFWGGYQSQADGLDFFLAGKKGQKDPQAELEATLLGFFSKAPVSGRGQHLQCQFPARLLWLKDKLQWIPSRLPTVRCQGYDRFRKTVQARSATLVFSSYYLNNPASAFGHTLLRLNKSGSFSTTQRYELLDHGVNYSAEATTKNPVSYAVKGISGFFKGSFTSVPYYYKVREYNDYEARDLWEYDLNLTSKEIEMLVAHIWELGSTYFDYYYLSENCSYHMLSILDAAAPQYFLVDRLRFYVIPADTIKVVSNSPGLISEVHYRPAIRSQFQFRIKKFSSRDRSLVHGIVTHRDLSLLPNSLETSRKAEILDTAIDYYDFKYARKILKEDPSFMGFRQNLLVARSRLGISSPDLNLPLPEEEEPNRGHDSARVGVGSGISIQTGPYLEVSHRFALHDLLDPLTGYPPEIEIEFLDFQLRQNWRDQSTWLSDLSLFHVVSLTDFSQFNHSPSWSFRVGGTTFRDEVCSNCFGGLLEGGIGITKNVRWIVPLWMTLAVEGEASGSPQFKGPDFRFRYGPMAQIRASLFPSLQFLSQVQYRRPLFTAYSSNLKSQVEIRWGLMRNLALNFQGKRFWKPDSWEGSLGLYYYY